MSGVRIESRGQAPDSTWVYASAAGDLLYQLDERGQRIADFSNCGYRGGTEPLPNVSVQIPQSRWVKVSPGAGDDTALIQNAINAVAAMAPDPNGWRGVVYLNAGEYEVDGSVSITSGGIVLKGAGDDPATGTRLRATGLTQDTLIKVIGSGSPATVSGTTRNLTQTLVPAGTRTFQVDSTSGLAAGNTVIVKRPSTANWIADMDMDLLGPGSGGEIDDVPWTAGSKDLLFDRVITRIDGNWITVDAPLPQTFESKYGGGQVWKYTWSGRIEQVGIEDIYGFSDYANSTDEAHAWSFIQMAAIQNGWVRNITARYFGYSAVRVSDGGKWITVADSQCLDAISIITGSRRYSFNNEGAELTLFQNNYARAGRHDFVFGASVPGPNAFVHGKGDTVHSDTGPHHRWSVGGLFDNITVNGNELNAQNRGNMGTGHGWAGGYMAVWNSVATGFRVRNPPTARNWLVGSIGNLLASSAPVGADPAGTYDRSGTTGKAVYPQSLYYAQLQQVLKWPDSQFRESWLGDIDQFASTGGTGNPVNCNAAWLAEVQALGPADSTFDLLTGNRSTAFTFDFALDPGDSIVSASLTVSLRDIGAASADDSVRLDSSTNVRTYASLGWTPVSSSTPTVRTMEVDPSLLADGRLNVALGADSAVDFAALHFQVRKSQPSTHTITLDPVADTYVQGGTNANASFGTAATLQTKDITASTVNREAFIRWDLTALAGRLVQAKVRLAGTSASQEGNQSCATLVGDDTWDEAILTFNKKPAAGSLFAQWLPVTGQPVEFSVTPQAAATLIDDGKLSLRIASTGNYGAAGNVTYASRESPTVANRPQLVLTFENIAPSISDVADQSILEDTVTAPLAITIGDDFTPGESLVVSATSSDTSLVPDDRIVVSGSGSNRSVTVTPLPGRSGTATITVTVSDGSLSASDTFVLTVIAVADPPAAGSGTAATAVNQAVEVDLRTLVSDSETPVNGLRFGVTGAAGGTVVLLADGHTARFTPALGFSGAGSFAYTVTHFGGQTAGNTVNVSVIQQIDSIADWRLHYFQTPENAGIAADTADPDHDGLANSQEYSLGTIPNAGDPAPLLTPAVSGSQITLVFTARQADGPGYTGLTRHYAVESAGDPGNAAGWVPVAGFSNITGQNQSVELTLPATETRGFFRLRVWLD